MEDLTADLGVLFQHDVYVSPDDVSVTDGRKHDLLFFWLCRATYDYEKKLYNDHLESLQVMDKNYITMARELEKLRAELSNSANIDRRAGISTI